MIDLGRSKERVLAAVRRTPSPVRAARSDARAVVRTSMALSLGLFFALDGVKHALGRPPLHLAASFAAWAAVALVVARGAWRWGGSFAPGSTLQLTTIALGTPVLLFAMTLALSRLAPGAPGTPGAAARCFALTLGSALYPLFGLAISRRASDPLHPGLAGAALGAASGASAAALVDVWCPVTDPPHVLAGHVLPVAVLVVAGAIIGDRILGMRIGLPPAGSRVSVPIPRRNRVVTPRASCDVSPTERVWGEVRKPRARGR